MYAKGIAVTVQADGGALLALYVRLAWRQDERGFLGEGTGSRGFDSIYGVTSGSHSVNDPALAIVIAVISSSALIAPR